MSRTTNRSQNAGAPNLVRTAQRTAGPGGGAPAPPANAFLGKPERVPEVAFIRYRKTEDKFLGNSKDYYELFGIKTAPVESIEQWLDKISTSATVWRRIVLVSHAHELGMIIPFFVNAGVGTNMELFSEFAKSDLDGLMALLPFPPNSPHLFNWGSIISSLMGLIRAANAAALQPFGFQSSGNPTQGDELFNYIRFAFDIVYLRDPLRVRLNDRQEAGKAGISKDQRKILEDFVREILTQIRPKVVTASGATPAQVDALRDVILGLKYAQLGVDDDLHPHLGLEPGMVNNFVTLKAAVASIRNGFRTKVIEARKKIDGSTIIDIRGCYAGEKEDYVEAIRTFLGTGERKPVVSAPRHYQLYSYIRYFKVMTSRADIANWISKTQFELAPSKLKDAFRKWAELVAIDPLHTKFWDDLLSGPAADFASMGWRNSIPPLFLPTPGLDLLKTLNLPDAVKKLRDYFNVPGTLPSAADLNDPAKRDTVLKPFMTAAADSLKNGDGLYFYMIFTGLPVFVHATPGIKTNGLVVLDAFQDEAMQSWYRCLWKDPLPATGAHKNADVKLDNFRQIIALVGANRTDVVSICPIPRYYHCMRIRPRPPDLEESSC
jgi:hypothetical protein